MKKRKRSEAKRSEANVTDENALVVNTLVRIVTVGLQKHFDDEVVT